MTNTSTKNGSTLVLEAKGQDSAQNQTKRRFLAAWVEAVNQDGGFGRWDAVCSRHPADVAEILESKSVFLLGGCNQSLPSSSSQCRNV